MKEINGQLLAEGMAFGIVVSRFNSFFTDQLVEGARDCLLRHGADERKLFLVRVPGASELPLAVQRLLKTGKFDAVLALGCVIQGATPHADLIEQQVARSLTQLALQYDTPVTGGLVAANNLEQAIERAGSKAGNKGYDCALSAIEMVNLLEKI